MLRPQLPLVFVDGHNLSLNNLPDSQQFLRMVDPLLRADFADVHHPLDAFLPTAQMRQTW